MNDIESRLARIAALAENLGDTRALRFTQTNHGQGAMVQTRVHELETLADRKQQYGDFAYADLLRSTAAAMRRRLN